MFSVQYIENLYTSLIHPSQHSVFNIGLHSWNRDSVVQLTQGEKARQKAGYDMAVSTHLRLEQYFKSFAGDIKDWDGLIRREKTDSSKEEIGIAMQLKSCDYKVQPLHFAMIDFNPGLEKINRYTSAFWKDLEKAYPGKKIHLFDSGSAHHGIMNMLLDARAFVDWLTFLKNHEEVVDQDWVLLSEESTYSRGVIRVTSGKNRPQPRLWKSIALK